MKRITVKPAKISQITIIGAGNLAFHLGLRIKKAGHKMLQAYNRSSEAGKELASVLSCPCITDINELSGEADMYIISVPDGTVEKILQNAVFSNKFVVHTSGSLSIDVFRNIETIN